ncbi:hypothetical protein [Paenarthrobacter sp. DKR-5]|uniref:trypsin-like serine peptidase n=1 Tax=Paenarthrobacter sp. DKR-5 TaxID=2835535 RepID=UPI0027DCD98F|nr:hypothetical protein [Paenarthrobacter sp. DKR-5]
MKPSTARRTGVLAAACLTALFCQTGPASAAPPAPSAAPATTSSAAPAPLPSAAADPVAHLLSEAQSGNAPERYWTPQRMRAARDASDLVAAAPRLNSASADVAGALPTAVEPVAPVPVSSAVRTAPASQVSVSDPAAAALRRAPVRTIGKVFFTMNGGDYVCSANSVAAGNRNTVSTAGHCAKDMNGGAYATNFAFAPGYSNGSAPYGLWSARAIVTTSGWASSGDINVDTAFVVVNRLKGRNLADVVGGSGVAFNQPRGLTYSAFGYPAAPPFSGQSLYSCGGRAKADTYEGSQSQGIPCSLNGGSSGGPWFIGSGSGGYQNSVNSFGYSAVKNTMFGPYWGTQVQQAYARASAS